MNHRHACPQQAQHRVVLFTSGNGGTIKSWRRVVRHDAACLTETTRDRQIRRANTGVHGRQCCKTHQFTAGRACRAMGGSRRPIARRWVILAAHHRVMNMCGTMLAVHRMMLRFSRSVVVNMNHGRSVRQKTVGCRHAGKRQGDRRRHDTQEIEQRNNAACSQSLGPGEAQISHPLGTEFILAARSESSKPEIASHSALPPPPHSAPRPAIRPWGNGTESASLYRDPGILDLEVPVSKDT